MSDITDQLHIAAAFMDAEPVKRNSDAELCREAAGRIKELEEAARAAEKWIDRFCHPANSSAIEIRAELNAAIGDEK